MHKLKIFAAVVGISCVLAACTPSGPSSTVSGTNPSTTTTGPSVTTTDPSVTTTDPSVTTPTVIPTEPPIVTEPSADPTLDIVDLDPDVLTLTAADLGLFNVYISDKYSSYINGRNFYYNGLMHDGSDIAFESRNGFITNSYAFDRNITYVVLHYSQTRGTIVLPTVFFSTSTMSPAGYDESLVNYGGEVGQYEYAFKAETSSTFFSIQSFMHADSFFERIEIHFTNDYVPPVVADSDPDVVTILGNPNGLQLSSSRNNDTIKKIQNGVLYESSSLFKSGSGLLFGALDPQNPLEGYDGGYIKNLTPFKRDINYIVMYYSQTSSFKYLPSVHFGSEPIDELNGTDIDGNLDNLIYAFKAPEGSKFFGLRNNYRFDARLDKIEIYMGEYTPTKPNNEASMMNTPVDSSIIDGMDLSIANGYYSNLDKTSDDFLFEIDILISTRNNLSYGDTSDTMVSGNQAYDEYGHVQLVFSGAIRENSEGTFGGNNDGNYAREHIYPQEGVGAETVRDEPHNILPADMQMKDLRGNKKFGNVENGTVATTIKGETTTTTYNSSFFDVRDEVKGDIARIMMYMQLVHELEATDWFESYAVLLEWHHLDPVDAFELNRNSSISGYSGNRNVFIDYPELATALFTPMVSE